MKILLIRFSSIGDIVLTTPVIRCIKNKYPHAELHFVTKKVNAHILEANPYLHKIHTLDNDIQPLLLELLKEKFDYIIDLHKNIRSRYIHFILRQAFNSNITYISFNKLNIRKWLYTHLKLKVLPDKSIVDRYFVGLQKIQVSNDGQGLDYFIPKDSELKNEDLPLSHVYGFVACAIGGQHATKQMPVEKWITLCKAIQHPIVLLGGKEDEVMANMIQQIDTVRIYNACGKFNLHESAHIIQKSKLVITHDTGLMHIAAAFKKTILSIWGNTVPAFGMFPYYGFNNLRGNVAPQSFLFQVNNLSCRPCSKIGYKACPKKHFDCMQKINVLEIAEKANSLLS